MLLSRVSSVLVIVLALSISGCDKIPGCCKCHKQQVHQKAPAIAKAKPHPSFKLEAGSVSTPAPSLGQCLFQDQQGISDCTGQAFRRFKKKLRAKILRLVKKCARKEEKGSIEELFCRAIG